MKHQKGSAAIWIIVIALIVVIAAGATYWYLTQGLEQSTPAQTTTPLTQATTSLQSTAENTTTQNRSPAQGSQQTGSALLNVSPASGEVPLTVTFSGGGSGGGDPVDGPFISFGDGSSQVQMSCSAIATGGGCAYPYSISHTYTTAGTYTAQIYSEATGGVIGSAAVVVTRSNAGASASGELSVSPASGASPLSVTFSADPVPSGAFINFGDGSVVQTNDLFGNSTANSAGYCGAGLGFFCSIPHTYTSAGTYTATLKNYSGVVIGTATVTVTSSSAQTYTDSRYGFSLDYPGTDPLETAGYASTHPFTNVPVAYIYGSDSMQTEGYISVNISGSSSDVANCTIPGAVYNAYQGSPAFVSSTNVSINGISFLRSDRADESGVAGLERDYTTVHDGSCYDIQIITFPDACVSGGCDDKQWSLQTESSLLDYLDPIAQTFSFLQ